MDSRSAGISLYGHRLSSRLGCVWRLVAGIESGPLRLLKLSLSKNTMEEKFEIWALVELMGHNKIAGLVTEHKFGNQSMLRVDVPAVGDVPSFTKIVAVGAVYAINPISETDARDYAALLKSKPLDIWDMQTIFNDRIKELIGRGELLRGGVDASKEVDDDDDLDLPQSDDDGLF